MANGEMRTVVWNVEHGSALYVRTPNDRSIVLDAGRSTGFSPAEWLNDKYGVKVDLFVLSHADTDHIRDIESVDKRLAPKAFIRNRTVPRKLVFPTDPPQTEPLKYYDEFDKRYNQELPEDSPLCLKPESNWGDVRIEAFYNLANEHEFNKLNDYSLATFLLYKNLEFLFPGDLEAPGWEALMEKERFCKISTPSSSNEGEIRILVAAHHGRKAGVYKPFLQLYQPHLTIISDVYGSPHTADDVYRKYTSGYPVYHVAERETRTRYTLTTKINDYIFIKADESQIVVRV